MITVVLSLSISFPCNFFSAIHKIMLNNFLENTQRRASHKQQMHFSSQNILVSLTGGPDAEVGLCLGIVNQNEKGLIISLVRGV